MNSIAPILTYHKIFIKFKTKNWTITNLFTLIVPNLKRGVPETEIIQKRQFISTTVEKLTIENMGIAFGILSAGGTEREIHLEVIYQLTPISTYVCKNTIATLRLSHFDTISACDRLTDSHRAIV